MTDPRLTTAAEIARTYRALAERAWDMDPDMVIRMEGAAERWESVDPDTIEPRF